jgi:hypothetical protein
METTDRSRRTNAPRAPYIDPQQTPSMKTRPFSILLLLTAFTLPFATSMAASNPKISAPIAYPVRAVEVDENGTTIVRGMTQIAILRLLGSSYRKLSDDSWMYRGYSSSHGPAQQRGCNQLVITFAKGKVVDINLVNRNAALLMAKGIPLKPAGHVVAAE